MRSYSRRTASFDNFTKKLAYEDISDDPDNMQQTQHQQYPHNTHNKNYRNGNGHNDDDFAKVKSHSIEQPNSPNDNEERSPYRQINRNKKTKSKYPEFRSSSKYPFFLSFLDDN